MEFKKLAAQSGSILVTGHTGFKGAWLCLLLKEMGLEVFGLSLPAEGDSMFNRLNLGKHVREFNGDIQNYDFVGSVYRELQPNVTIHMAAQSLVSRSFTHPLETFNTNVIGTANILENCRRLEKDCVVAIVTTDKVYKNLENQKAFTEDDELGGNEPYSSSKVGAEEVVNAWRHLATNSKILSLRAGNVIGGGDLSDGRLLPDIVRQKFQRKELCIRNPNATRPWQHALDPLTGYLAAIEYALNDGNENTFNFGPTEKSLSVHQVLEVSKKSWGELQYSKDLDAKPMHESQHLELDSSLARSKLKWSPRMSQEQAIKSTLDWWDHFYEQKKTPLEITTNQIKEYISLESVSCGIEHDS